MWQCPISVASCMHQIALLLFYHEGRALKQRSCTRRMQTLIAYVLCE